MMEPSGGSSTLSTKMTPRSLKRPIVDDLVIDVDGLVGKEIDDLIHDVDRHSNAGTESTWACENEAHRVLLAIIGWGVLALCGWHDQHCWRRRR